MHCAILYAPHRLSISAAAVFRKPLAYHVLEGKPVQEEVVGVHEQRIPCECETLLVLAIGQEYLRLVF